MEQKFYELVLKLSDEKISKLFNVGKTTIGRWKGGKNTPHHLIIERAITLLEEII